MKRIFLSAGHANTKGRDNGAAGNGFIEGVEMAELRQIIAKELEVIGAEVITDKDDSILADTLKEFKPKTTENDIAIDFHLNSATPKATGVETLVPDPPTALERKLAENISQTVSNILGIPLRGVKGVKTEGESQHKRLGFMRLAGTTVLLEVCFISNPNDIKSYREKRFELGKALAKVLFESAKDSTVQTQKIYTVVAGDTISKIAIKNNTTILKIKKDNSLNSDLITIGQKLKL